jgi:glycosyltransferase involved in cell wall biosynthesis
LRIAQVAPLLERVPPVRYGGTERVVSWLTEELVRRGHEVTLFATGDSITRAELVPCVDRALRGESGSPDATAMHIAMHERLAERAREFDVIHFHTDLVHFPLVRRITTPSLTTLHGRLDLCGYPELFSTFPDVGLVSISDAQRAPVPHARWLGTVHHGMPVASYRPGDGRGGYFVFLGRISVEKRPDRAIEIAKRARTPLKIAAKVDSADRAYFERVIAPMIDDPLIEMLGEVGEAEKEPLLRDASALLFPIDWPEPFGLVVIESMLCGTPVVAFGCGSVPELVDDGATGFVVSDLDAAVEAARRAPQLDRKRIRARAEARFSVERMTRDYLGIYEQLAAGERARAA